MNLLAIDTSGSHLTVLIKKGDENIVNFNDNAGLKHSVTLLTDCFISF